ncbi:MAG: hypothetical protein UZ12_BCD005000043 [Bacteroidetes bacterium OLB12]|nr:MAG: hypothetical protein UZ12_BCD005000043 [Bacteroidetes bacterium OLB12]
MPFFSVNETSYTTKFASFFSLLEIIRELYGQGDNYLKP